MAGVPWITAVRDGWKWRGEIHLTTGAVLLTPSTYWRRTSAVRAALDMRKAES